MNHWIIYGANGYTGRLVVEEALRRGLSPILGGRDRRAIESYASQKNLQARVFDLEDPGALLRELTGFRTVLHCAGPFINTAEKMALACLEVGADYLDISGEIPVFESLHALSGRAIAAKVTLMPGVGFDVVPSDCLALKLSEQLPGSESLELAFAPRGGVSAGTLKTMLEFIHEGCTVRRGGVLTRLERPLTREIPFHNGTRRCFSISWGDVSTAYRTTGIGNITTYIYQKGGQKMQPLLKLTRLGPVRRILQALVTKIVKGPDASTREKGGVELWGRVTRGPKSVEMTLTTPEGYRLTAMTAVEIACRSLAREIPAGFQTPAMAFGSKFIETFPGVTLRR